MFEKIQTLLGAFYCIATANSNPLPVEKAEPLWKRDPEAYKDNWFYIGAVIFWFFVCLLADTGYSNDVFLFILIPSLGLVWFLCWLRAWVRTKGY